MITYLGLQIISQVVTYFADHCLENRSLAARKPRLVKVLTTSEAVLVFVRGQVVAGMAGNDRLTMIIAAGLFGGL